MAQDQEANGDKLGIFFDLLYNFFIKSENLPKYLFSGPIGRIS